LMWKMASAIFVFLYKCSKNVSKIYWMKSWKKV
jgi:hypothetical protein